MRIFEFHPPDPAPSGMSSTPAEIYKNDRNFKLGDSCDMGPVMANQMEQIHGGSLAYVSHALECVGKVAAHFASTETSVNEATREVKIICKLISEYFFPCTPDPTPTDVKRVTLRKNLRSLHAMLDTIRMQVYLAIHRHDVSKLLRDSDTSEVIASSEPCKKVGGRLTKDAVVKLHNGFFREVMPNWGLGLVGEKIQGKKDILDTDDPMEKKSMAPLRNPLLPDVIVLFQNHENYVIYCSCLDLWGIASHPSQSVIVLSISGAWNFGPPPTLL